MQRQEPDTAQDEVEHKQVPLAELLEERKKRQESKAELEQTRREYAEHMRQVNDQLIKAIPRPAEPLLSPSALPCF